MSNLYPRGIDVSNNNGIFNWADWKGKIQFAGMKATEGLTFKDDQFPRNWEYAKKYKLYRLAYHYGHPNLDPADQAKYFTDTVRAQGLQDHDNFYLDLEETDGMAPVDVSFWAWTFCTEMNRLNPGHRILVYTNRGFALEGNCAKLGGWGLWLADWNPAPVVPPPWRYWRFWQNTGTGLDEDVFQGTMDEMEIFLGSSGRSVPPKG
jgi:lysozyme